MKKLLASLALLMFVGSANAEVLLFDSNINLNNYWNKNGIEVQKVNTVARNIIHSNGLRRAPIKVEKNWRVPNATTNIYTKSL